MKESFVVQEQDLEAMAQKIIQTLASTFSGQAKVLFLEGDLGAGKTTFTKEIATVLGIEKEDVHSPTFILKKEYKGSHSFFKKLIHVDAYRFESKEEAKALKLQDDLNNHDTLIVVEWPSRLSIKKPDMIITLTVVDDTTRKLEVSYDHL
jgi:tRNA threonylcarbamoyladenosine biosynthesis protein TsaE